MRELSEIETSTPIIIVKINGQDIDLSFGPKIISFQFDDLADGDDEITVVIADPYGKLIDDPLIQVKNELEVQWGYPGMLSPVRKGVLLQPEYKFEGARTITLKALDKGSKLHGRSEQKIWQNMRYSDIVTQIAEKHGLKPVIGETHQIIESLPQGNRSDYEFITFMASEENYKFYIDVDELHFHKEKKVEAPIAIFDWWHHGNRFLKSFIPKYNAQTTKAEATETTAVGFDPIRREPVIHKANAGTKDELALGPQTLMVNVETGDTQYTPTETGHLTATPHQSKNEVAKEAEFQRTEAEMEQATATAKIIGLPYIKTHQVIVINGVSEKFSGRWSIERATHLIGSDGFEIDFELERDAVGEERAAAEQREGPSHNEPMDNDQEEIVRINIETGEVN